MSAENRRSLEKVTTGDFTGGGLLSPEQFDEFFTEVQDQSQVLSDVRQQAVSAPSGQIPKLGVGERLLQAVTEASSGTEETVTSSEISFQTSKVSIPWSLSWEAVNETIEDTGTAQTIMGMFAQQFGVDLEDLAVNGDEASVDSFLSINDGWLKIADTRAAPSYNHADGSGTAQPVNKALFKNMIQQLDAKYKRNNDLVFLMSQAQKEEYKDYLTDRSTGAGDAMLMTGEEPNPYGYEVLAPVNFPDDRAMLTNPQNLMYIIQRDMEVRQTQDGAEVTRNDLYAIYNMLAKVDFQIEDENALVVASNIAAPA